MKKEKGITNTSTSITTVPTTTITTETTTRATIKRTRGIGFFLKRKVTDKDLWELGYSSYFN